MHCLDHRGIDLEALIGQSTDLRKMGRSLRGPCPLHNGTNPTALTIFEGSNGWLWKCQSGCGSGDAIAWRMAKYGESFLEARDGLGLPDNRPAEPRPLREPQQPDPLPSAIWHAQAADLADRAAAALWEPQGAKALAYLHKRGLTDATIRAAQLGYHGRKRWVPRADWDVPIEDGDPVKMLIPLGVVIPWYVDGCLPRVSIRTDDRSLPKYFNLAGSGNVPYGIDLITPSRPAIMVEGVFDALAIQQVAADLVTPIATGTTGSRRVRWASRIAIAPRVILAYDADPAGAKACAYWADVFTHSAAIWRPTFDDPAAMLQVDPTLVRQWVIAGLARLGLA